MDFDNQGNYPTSTASSGYLGDAKLASVPTVKQRIAMAVKQAEDRLVAVKRAQEILAKNPELEELLDIMQRSHF
jgi:hypothetical protein